MNKQLGTGESGEALPHAPPASAMSRVGEAPARSGLATRRWIILAVLALLLAAAGGIWWSVGGDPVVRYETAPVTTGEIARSINATGTVNPELTIIVGTYV
ncbi:MAG: hypothetical protein Q7U92_04760, partial [Bradyrhizobium sp.]|nr:hypothetical protein [Bradyrhizobium sp.]